MNAGFSPADLAGMLPIHSWLADDLIAYLAGPDPDHPAGLVGELDALPLFRAGKRLTIRSLFIEPMVLTERVESDLRPRRGGPDGREEEDRGRDGKRVAVLEDMARHLYERERREGEHESVRLGQFLRTLHKPAVLIGSPGGGKTCGTRKAVLDVAIEAAGKLRAGTWLPEDVRMPVWVTATDLGRVEKVVVAAEVPPETAHLFEAAAALLAAHGRRTERALSVRLREFFIQALVAGRAFVVVDSLDEVPLQSNDKDLEKRLRTRLAALVEMGVGLVLTCRTKDWPQRLFLSPVPDKPAELGPLRARERREFARRFFGEDAALRSSFERRLAGPGFLPELFETPLMLNLCRVAARGWLATG